MAATIIVIVLLGVVLVATVAIVVAENGVRLRVRPTGMVMMMVAHRHALGLVQSLWTILTTIVTCGTRRAPA